MRPHLTSTGSSGRFHLHRTVRTARYFPQCLSLGGAPSLGDEADCGDDCFANIPYDFSTRATSISPAYNSWGTVTPRKIGDVDP